MGTTGANSGVTNSIPSAISRLISVSTVSAAARNAGLEYVSSGDLSESDVGSEFVITQPIMRSRLDSRRDPSSVEFLRATYQGKQTGAFGRPLFKVGDRTIILEDDMPYESIYRRRR